MTNPTQPQLDPRPPTLDVPGPQLEAKLAELRAQGARVTGMVAVENALWRVRLDWGTDDQPDAA